MEPDVIEIPPPPLPPSRPNKRPKRKQDIMCEVIDVDNYEDTLDVIILDEKIDKKNKGKAIEANANVYNQTKEVLANYIGDHPESSVPGSNKPIIIDGVNSDFFNGSEYIDIYSDDLMGFDEYSYLQAHFDNVDIPTDVEAPVPNLLDSVNKANKSISGIASFNMGYQSDIYPFGSLEFKNTERTKKLASVSNSPFQVAVNSGNASGANLTSSSSSSSYAQSKNKQISTQLGVSTVNPPYHLRKRTPVTSRSSTYNKFSNQLPKMPFSYNALLRNNKGGINTPVLPNLSGKLDSVMGSSESYFKLKPSLANPQHPSYSSFISNPSYSSFFDPYTGAHNLPDQGVARVPKNVNADDVLRKYQTFKQFDTVEDHSDHHFASKGYSVKQPPKNWAKRIQDEWKILQKDLPDTIFVRVYESRMDLLRAVIIGAEGTPYHDGLFFFDVSFPSGYPSKPPNVHYHSGGLRLNPNLYNCGKVCLSLLGTWGGTSQCEKWQPGVSTVLQVLVSIQALILNQKPYFNEPGYAAMNGTANGEKSSLAYNENTFTLSLKTMVYSMRKPPKHFEDFVLGHFHKYGRDILISCKAYMEGVQVGCLVKGGVQDVDEGHRSCSIGFKTSLPSCVDLLLKELSLIGVKNCEQFQSLAKGMNNQVRIIQHPGVW